MVAEKNLTWHDIRTGDLVTAARRLARTARLAARIGDVRLRALAHANLAEVARLDGRYPAAALTARRALVALAEIGDPGQRVRVLGTLGLALAHDGQLAEASAVFAELPESGPRSLLGGYLALARKDAVGAAERFAAAAEALSGRHDARDVVEALVGLACAAPAALASTLARLADVRRRGAIALLPRERAMLAAAGVPPPD